MTDTDEVISQLISYWGFSCPKGGGFYICPESKSAFLGCCSVDPCTEERDGVCPDDKLSPATFAYSKWDILPAQGCAVSSKEALFYTCQDATPPLMACCTSNPCNAGCPPENLRAAVLNNIAGEASKRDYLLNPNGSGISYNMTKDAANKPGSSISSTIATSTSQPTSSSTNLPTSNTNEPDSSGGLSTGAIAGIAVGGVITILIIVAGILWMCGWFPRKKKEEENKQEANLPGAAMSHADPMSPMSQHAYPHQGHQGHQGYGYADESGRSVMSSPSTGYIRDSYVSGLTGPGSQYGSPSPALSKAGLHSQHASPHLPQEGFDHKYGYNGYHGYNGYQNNGLGLDTVSELPVTDQHFGAQELPAGNHPGFEMDAGPIPAPQEQKIQQELPTDPKEGNQQDAKKEPATKQNQQLSKVKRRRIDI